MPAYNFQKQFAPLVESGQKLCTIRQTDKGAKVGDPAYLYYGQRTKQCQWLGKGTIVAVSPIKIWMHDDLGCLIAQVRHPSGPLNYIGSNLDRLAKDDGFQSGDEMASWFSEQYGLPFNGFLHTWVLNKP